MQAGKDTDLIEKCLNNDRNAQKALYHQHKVQMYTLAYRITNNTQDAEDALQEGFLNVFKSLSSFQGGAQLSTWIHTIIARAAIKKVKTNVNFEEIEQVNQ